MRKEQIGVALGKQAIPLGLESVKRLVDGVQLNTPAATGIDQATGVARSLAIDHLV